MKKLIALLVVALSSATLHAQVVWTEETINPITGLRTGVIEANGNTFSIGPNAMIILADLSEADLSGADLRGANLFDSDITGANLSGANLSGASLVRANLISSILTDADLSFANLTLANLRRANLSFANLSGANFNLADLGGANLLNTMWSTPDPRITELEAQLEAIEAERDALLADIQFAFDQVNAAAGGADSDLVAVVDPENVPSEVQSVGVIAQPLEAFEVNTFDSPNNLDTELGLYDADGNLVRRNDDAVGLQSQLNFSDGLAGGAYYLAVGTFNSTFSDAEFEVSSTGPGGEYTLTLPTGPVSGTLEASGIDWYRIEIGTVFTAVQLQPLTELYSNLVEANTSAILERDAAISERDARPTLDEVQDARVGSLVFRADEGANLLDLRFFIQSSENLQDWEITGECNFLLPMDTGKKFLRIALR